VYVNLLHNGPLYCGNRSSGTLFHVVSPCPFEPDVLRFQFDAGEELVLTHDECLRLVIAVYKRYHKGVHPPGTANSRMLNHLSQTVHHENRRRRRQLHPMDGNSDSAVDKTDPLYVERLAQARLARLAAKSGIASEEQLRGIALKCNTEREHRDLTAYSRVNTKMYPDFFVADLYKTGYKADLHRADVKAERTVKKVEARRLAAVALKNCIRIGH
jgi:hypothetical protein